MINEYTIKHSKMKHTKSTILIALIMIVVSFYCGLELISLKTAYGRYLRFTDLCEIIINFFIIYYFSVFLHEMGHLIVYKIYRYPIKLFVVGPFVCAREEVSFKIKFKITPLVLGGSVMIDLNNVLTEKLEYNTFIKSIKRMLLGGVLVTGILVITGIGLIFSQSFRETGIILVLLNVSSVLSSMIKFGNSAGDLILIKYLNKNPQNMIPYFAENLRLEYPINKYCMQIIIDYIDQALKQREINSLTLNLIDAFLEYNQIENKNFTEETLRFLNWLVNSFDELILTKSIAIRVAAINLINRIDDFKTVKENTKKITSINSYKVKKHPLYKIYIEFDSYAKKQC
ncbi:hypothetical protein JHL18_05785 [Clostridium sp. YIM B02505]|uniref:Peptidase M50 domain-containing protein n=1 Tax=Clostridium yunnanense TaxID=2800325 RepID=A0ABS1ELA6_9CLOT|nr:site-2 protease family protein [Clostridium yunnanense]MBK1810157.1 hypothetical protein [Clostridium yunnanense]